MSIGGPHARLRLLVLERDGYVCQIVPGCPTIATHADHIIPRAFGGRDELDNYRAACAHHNCARNARPKTKTRDAKKVARVFDAISQDPTAVPALSPTNQTERT